MKGEGSHHVTLKKVKTYHTPIGTSEAKIKKVNLANAAIQGAARKLRFD